MVLAQSPCADKGVVVGAWSGGGGGEGSGDEGRGNGDELKNGVTKLRIGYG